MGDAILEIWNSEPKAPSLLALARHTGKLDTATTALMTKVDGRGFELRCTYRSNPTSSANGAVNGRKAAGVQVKNIEILFPALLKSQDAVIASLEAMSENAADALGVSIAPPTPTLSTTDTLFASPSSSSSSTSSTTARDPTNLFPVLPSPFNSDANESTSEVSATNGTPASPVHDSSFGRIRIPHIGWWVSIVGGLGAVYWLAFYDTNYGSLPAPLSWLHWFGYLVFRSKLGLQILWWVAFGLHVGEALIAGITCHRRGVHGRNMYLWIAQTFILGFPSLGLLRSTTSRSRAPPTSRSNGTTTPLMTSSASSTDATSADANKKTH